MSERQYSTSLIRKPFRLRRIAERLDTSKMTRTYGDDNLYPQRVSALIDGSGTGKSCVKNLSKYIYGGGFENESINDIVLNAFTNLKPEKLLRCIALDKAKYNIWAVHVNYNLNGEITLIQPLKSKNCRFGIQINDVTKRTNKIAYSPNWDRYTQDLLVKTLQIQYYDIFNPSPEIVKQQIAEAGGIDNYKGQIYYVTPEDFIYPQVEYDAVLNSLQFEDQKSIFNVSNIINNFSATYVYKQLGGFTTETQQEETADQLNQLTGAENAGSVLVVEVSPQFKDSKQNVIEVIPQVDTDKMYSQTSKDSKESIIESFAVPKVLIGIYPEGGLINSAQFAEAHHIYNSHTEIYRDEIKDQLNPLFDNFYINMGGNYAIIQKSFKAEETEKGEAKTEKVESKNNNNDNEIDEENEAKNT